ncbi:hypothetical protein [Aestuariivivens sediminis]|uniref:hypothetical protein n=1 Tax=Aestuariivivens sediminis TaxID=2913557 RepID=UPI001F5A2196|nr:hypothetical protein [Aestuariivivens sediminis]
MKNVLTHTKKVILIAAVFAVTIGYANENSLNTNKKNLRATALTINNVKEGNLLSIKSENGIILYKESIEESGKYSKHFDLTELPDGNYYFELDKDVAIKVIPFTVKLNEVSFSKEEETTIFKPFLREKGDLVYITKLAIRSEPLKITVFRIDHSGSDLLHTETIKGVQNIGRVYKLKEGNYKIVCHSNNKEFTKYITI